MWFPEHLENTPYNWLHIRKKVSELVVGYDDRDNYLDQGVLNDKKLKV